MLKSFEKLKANMSIKLHLLHNHLDKFPSNLKDYSKEQDERFHQDIQGWKEGGTVTYEENLIRNGFRSLLH